VIPTIAEAARQLAAKKLSPVELLEACLARVERLQPQLHAFITLTAERAREEAKAAERAIMKGGPKSPLHGIPLGLKDIIDTAGVRTTCHSRQLEDNVPAEDAAVAARLGASGALRDGKLATHEFAFDLPWPPARNPWNPEHFTGGSSSGTAAAVASGMVLGGLGSDTGGSIRSPAALCGITGLKPTYGRVSRRGVFPLAYSMDNVGPMAWTAEDCAILLQALAGHDPQDPASADVPVPSYTARLNESIKGVRIGVVRHFFEKDNKAEDQTVRAIDAALAALKDQGAAVREVTLSPLEEWFSAGMVILLAEGYAVHERWFRTSPEKYGESFRDRLAMGAFLSAADLLAAQRRRRELAQEMAAAFADVDILATAAQPGEAQRIREVPKWGLLEAPGFAMPFNVSGAPAISVCCGFSSKKLPLALQLAARPFEEDLLLRVAHAYERATGWRNIRPAD
jgi:aspartyl-tRNA(Asn)/glutamyl-tRNA(Gln) amidotransferase subunit A